MKDKSFAIIFMMIFPLLALAQQIMDLPQLPQLPIHSVHRIFQDREGFIWYGTSDGLCRDDGYSIQIIRSDIHTPNVMQSNLIFVIAEDTRNQLWLGTEKGVYILNKKTFRIHQLDNPETKDIKITSINSTADGSMWISVPSGLCQFSPDEKLKTIYPINKGDGHVDSFYEDKEGNIWICVRGEGVCKVNRDKNSIESFAQKRGAYENNIVQDKTRKYYWVGTWGNGIKRFDPNTNEGLRYIPQPGTYFDHSIMDNYIINMVQDDVSGYLWVTTLNNLLAFSINSQGMLEQVNTSSFLSNDNKMLSEVIKDKDKNLWIAAYDRKSFIINLQGCYVNEYKVSALQQRIKINPAIVSLCRDDDDNLFWISQDRYGIYLYSPDPEILVHFDDCPATRNKPLQSIPYLIKSKKRGKIWAMTENATVYGVSQSNLSMKMEETIDLRNISDNPGTLETIFEDFSGNLWMGTTTGLFVYHNENEALEAIEGIKGNTAGITETADGALWICVSKKGVYRLEKNKITRFFPNNKNLSCIDATSDGKLWVGTFSSEILFLNPEKGNHYTDYTQICNMKGDVLEMILVDSFNHLWILTNQQVKEFNPNNNIFRNYSAPKKSFILDRYLPRAAYKANDNTMYFGGIPGFISIKASNRLQSIPKQIKPIITNITVDGESLFFDRHLPFLPNGKIDIESNSYNIEVCFSTLDYWNASQIRYAYKLSGIDKDWNYPANGNNTAFYNRLNKGKYTFQVKATDENGLWSDYITEFTINKLPAWYESWWAYMLYSIFFGSILFIMFYLYIQKVKQENNKKMVEQVAQLKLRYFTNISHDLMTPLSIFSCVIDEMQTNGKEDPSRIKLLQSNVLRLKRLLQQVLDFRKVESGNMKLNVSYGDITAFVKDICEIDFAPLIKSKQISFSLSMESDKIEGYFDFDKLDKILFNLLSNAFKYTPDGKIIGVNMKVAELNRRHYVEIMVHDQGQGIDKKNHNKIFTRFYNNKLSEAGISNGIGLSLVKELVELHHGSISLESEVGKGSAFTLKIPIDRDSYKEDEINGLLLTPENQEMDEIIDNELSDTYNILFVEDNEELLLLVQRIFSRRYNVFTARNGKQALGVIEQYPIDVVVSDIMMPEMDGLELCKTIKNDFRTSHIIVILLTAKTSTEDRIESYQVDADDYIPKPVEMNVLRARLENLLRAQKQKQELFKKMPSINITCLETPSLNEQLIIKALSVVEANLGVSNFDISKLADELNITRITLSRKIKAITGQTSLEFIRDIKMKHACRMLQNPAMSVSEVVIALGYTDHGYFTSIFKGTFGITPSEYQKKIQTGPNI